MNCGMVAKLHLRSAMRLIKYASAIPLGLLIAASVTLPTWVFGLAMKPFGGSVCSWSSLAELPTSSVEFNNMQKSKLERITLIREDGGLQLYQTPTRQFWISKSGGQMDGHRLLAYVIAEQEWIASRNPGQGVALGDVVVDIGAHIGTFGDDALRLGASKVVMVEPDPTNVECIRRNFKKEIADGRVVVVPEGAWNTTATMDFQISGSNSGMGSVVKPADAVGVIKVPVRPLDDILRSIGVDRVNFIKMDIEGAEREALKGMAVVLTKWKPRLMIDSYHLPDDDTVLPAVVKSVNSSYVASCAICSFQGETNKPIPYVVFYK